MTNPLLSIIIPTHNRPQLVIRAVKSALEQTMENLEVIVVDDASQIPPELPQDSRLRMIRLPKPSGGAAARNVGTKAACSRWVTYLDDDDRLLPNMASVSLKALSENTSKSPVAVISGLEAVDAQGKVSHKRIPPKLRKQGSHFFLEELELGYSYNTKQTLVVEKKVIEQIGGWDETFRSRVHSELFLRLNPACSIIGLPVVTYQLTAHEGPRVSRNVQLRQESFQRLINKHENLFKAHPQMFACFVYEQSLMCQQLNQQSAAISNFLWAMQINPVYTCKRLIRPVYYTIFKKSSLEKTA
ncbi:MAG: glycosyltransferase [Rivularia sp. T60_A2020_040]|nr:glycosyltransferase [Rivularia sp. T60_A2020_040]